MKLDNLIRISDNIYITLNKKSIAYNRNYIRSKYKDLLNAFRLNYDVFLFLFYLYKNNIIIYIIKKKAL